MSLKKPWIFCIECPVLSWEARYEYDTFIWKYLSCYHGCCHGYLMPVSYRELWEWGWLSNSVTYQETNKRISLTSVHQDTSYCGCRTLIEQQLYDDFSGCYLLCCLPQLALVASLGGGYTICIWDQFLPVLSEVHQSQIPHHSHCSWWTHHNLYHQYHHHQT